MVGRIMEAKVRLPLRIDQPNFNLVTNRIKPKSPKIIEGIPAKQSAPKRMMRVIRPSRVYSFKKIALPTPKGVAIRMATIVRAIVPIIVEKMPPLFPISVGFEVKKERLKTGRPFFKIKNKIKNRVKMVIRVNVQRRTLINPCSFLGLKYIFYGLLLAAVRLATVLRIMMMIKRITPVANRACRCSPLA